MQRLVLTKAVEISGTDFWGRAASLRLEPTHTAGWFWHIGGEDVPLSRSLLRIAKRRIFLAHNKATLHVFEHLGALRFTGLDGIRIIAKTSWLPYDGRSAMYWSAVAPFLKQEGVLQPLQRTHGTVALATPADAHGMSRSIHMELNGQHHLQVTALVDYPNWGSATASRVLPSSSMEDLFTSRPLARPSWLRPVGRIASRLGWPHDRNVLWPQGKEGGAIVEELARHRLLDLLGALSVIPASGEYLTGTVRSYCGNHALDVAAIAALG